MNQMPIDFGANRQSMKQQCSCNVVNHKGQLKKLMRDDVKSIDKGSVGWSTNTSRLNSNHRKLTGALQIVSKKTKAKGYSTMNKFSVCRQDWNNLPKNKQW